MDQEDIVAQPRRCGVSYYTDTQERAWLPLLGIKQSVYWAEFLAVVRAREECQPHETVTECKGVVRAVQTVQTGRRHPKGRNSDLEKRGLLVLLPGQRIRWMEAHQKQDTVDRGVVTAEDHHGNGQADVLANQGTAAHGPLDPDATWTRWADFADKVYHFWRLVGRKFVSDLKLSLATPAEDASDTGIVGMAFLEAPFQLEVRQKVVRHAAFLYCLDCGRQTGKVKGEYNFSYIKRQD
eukprot:5442339-Amphidinium_carterae.1